MELIIGGIVLAVLIFWWIAAYNGFIKTGIWIEESWAQIDVQLKLRYDLIPNLVETVKGYAKHESETLEKVIQARNGLVSGGSINEQMQSNDMLTGALKSVFALSESYPDLKANQGFLDLQEKLTQIENKVAYARQLYNKTVATYNTKTKSIPTNIVANVHGFKEKEMIEATEEERKVVKVEF